ncbi:hypothetical protein [Enterobacter hormaechei]
MPILTLLVIFSLEIIYAPQAGLENKNNAVAQIKKKKKQHRAEKHHKNGLLKQQKKPQ